MPHATVVDTRKNLCLVRVAVTVTAMVSVLAQFIAGRSRPRVGCVAIGVLVARGFGCIVLFLCLTEFTSSRVVANVSKFPGIITIKVYPIVYSVFQHRSQVTIVFLLDAMATELTVPSEVSGDGLWKGIFLRQSHGERQSESGVENLHVVL